MNRPGNPVLTCLCLLIALFTGFFTNAQTTNPKVDSLRQKLDNLPEKDSLYTSTLLALSMAMVFTDPDQAEKYAREAIDLSTSLHNRYLEVRANNVLGVTYLPKNEYAEAIIVFQKALELERKHKLFNFKGSIYNNLGIAYSGLGDYSQSLIYYQKAEAFYDSTGNKKYLASLNDNLGNLFKRKGQIPEARKHFEKALSEFRQKNDSIGMAAVQLNYALLHTDNGDYEDAQKLLDSALVLFKKHHEYVSQVAVLNALGKLNILREEYTVAEEYLKPALTEAERLEIPEYIFSILGNLGRIAEYRKSYSQAEEFHLRALDIAKKLDNLHMLSNAESQLARIYEAAGRFEEALYHHKNFKSLGDSIFNEQQASIYESQKVQWEVHEQEEQLKSQARELEFLEERIVLENRWKWLLAIASLLLLFVGILYYQKFQSRREYATNLETQNELVTSQKNKLEAIDKVKNKFFTNISHEFRTPLNLILGPLRTYQEKIPPVELGMMQRNAERLLRLINQLLDLARLESGQMKLTYRNVDLFTFLRGIVAAFSLQAHSRNISLQIDIPPRKQLVRFDPEKVEQIVYNLLSNALKFTPEGGKVSMFAALDEPLTLRFTITDTGLGVPAHLHDKIFDRFYQVDGSSTRPFEGTGIGLSLTKELVELHGGNIALDSEIKRGCRFTVQIPLQPYDPTDQDIEGDRFLGTPVLEYTRKQEAPAPLVNIDGEKPLLLVVEDHPDLRHYLISQLGDIFHYLEAINGEEGLALALEHVPDVIISDVMMPKMDGIELTEKLKSNPGTSHIPIILLTAKNDPETRREGFHLGADQYLAKPFDTEEVRARLQSVLLQTKRLREKYSEAVYLKPREIEIEDHEALFLNRAIQIIEEHMDNSEFSVSLFQKEIGMSRMQLHRKLKALTGKTSSEFVRYIRLQRAAELLKSPDAQVADVAYRVGFSHLSYFAKCFKEQFGEVPSEYQGKAV